MFEDAVKAEAAERTNAIPLPLEDRPPVLLGEGDRPDAFEDDLRSRERAA